MKSNCEECSNYIYDDELDAYFCDIELDEDELVRYYNDSRYECPYYRSNDDYKIVKKQM